MLKESLVVCVWNLSKPASKPYTIIWLPTNNRALLSIKMCSKGFVSHPIPSSSGHLQTQCSPSSSHEGFVSVCLESFQTRIHPIPSFSDHISRALLILLPSNLPLKVWYVSLNYFKTPHPPYTIIWLPTKAELFFPSNSAQRFVSAFKFFQPQIHPIPSSGPLPLLLVKLFLKLSYLCVWNLSRPASTLHYHLALYVTRALPPI